MKKKVLIDSIINIFSSTMPLILLQLFIYPIVARDLGDQNYGVFITLVSLFTLFSQPFGSSLNNTRLLKDRIYKEKGYVGDFNVILFGSIFINIVVLAITLFFYIDNYNLKDIILIIFISISALMRLYLVVAFRIELNYIYIFLNNLYLVIGYFVGFVIFLFDGSWHFIFIFGYLFSLLFTIKNSSLLRERFKITPFFKSTLYQNFILFTSSLLQTSLSYADKLILFPLLGAKAVAIYYSATIVGKILSMGINPVSNVILSYLAKEKEVNKNNFFSILFFLFFFGSISYFICIWISEPLLRILYPAWYENSMELIYITTATAILNVIASVIHPFVLRYKHINWQLKIASLNFSTYILGSVILFKYYDIIGFCVGILISSLIRVLLMIKIYITDK